MGNNRTSILFDGTAEARLADILSVMDSRTFPRRESESIVGGPKKLEKLVEADKVRVEFKNQRMYFNASDVLRHVRRTTVRYRKKKNS